ERNHVGFLSIMCDQSYSYHRIKSFYFAVQISLKINSKYSLSFRTPFLMRIIFFTLVVCSIISPLKSQDKILKALDHSDFLIWKTIQDIQLSADGTIITYRLVPGEGDPALMIYSEVKKSTHPLERVSKSNIDYDGKFIYGIITPYRDSLRNFERKKIEKKKWPGDTLFIYDVNQENTLFIPYIINYKYPAKQGDYIAYTVKQISPAMDTIKDENKSGKETH